MATWIPAVVVVLVALVTVASFFRSATAGRVLAAIMDNPMTAVGTLFAVLAAFALMVGSANSTTALRRDVGGVRSDVNERIDGVRHDVNERIDTTNERIDTTNERIGTTNERIDAGFAQITQEIRALRPPSQDADQ